MDVSSDRMPGLRMPGMLLHPDKYDGLRYPSRATRIPLTPARFAEIVAYLEGLQAGRAEGSLSFGLVDRSCVWFLTEVAARAGVQIDANYDLIQAATDLLPDMLRRRLPDKVRYSPRSRGPMGRAAWRVYDVCFNLGLYWLGGRRVMDKEWVRTTDGSVAGRHVRNLSPVFDRPGSIFGPAVPFFHVRALIRWQGDFQPQDPADPDPPDRRQHNATEAGGD